MFLENIYVYQCPRVKKILSEISCEYAQSEYKHIQLKTANINLP